MCGASEFLMSGKLKANNIAYQVGSNDLEDSTTEEVVNSIKTCIGYRLVPGNNIIIQGYNFSDFIVKINPVNPQQRNTVIFEINNIDNFFFNM